MIEIMSYQNRWPQEFQVIAEKVKKAIDEQAIAIHHIGSTSVPYLAAKDIIDIQITVEELTAPIDMALAQFGFVPTEITEDHCPTGMIISQHELQKRFFHSRDRRIHLHIRKVGAYNQRYPILFRDFLRGNPMARDAYGEIKKQLARYFPDNLDIYYDIKDPACDLIILGAIEWAKSIRWTPGSS